MRLSKPQINLTKVKAERCRRSFYYFFKEFWPVIESEKLVDNWHIEYLCGELEYVARRVFDRKPKEHDLIINIPPGSTKSTIVTVMFPAWCWTIDPSIRSISSSYSSSLSIDHAVKSRDIILSDKYREMFGIELKADQSGKSQYKNTQSGERIATSTGGTITGKHGHFLLIDDPVNPKKAASEAERKNANEHIDQTLNTRKVDKEVSVTILVMQRLHADDPTGHLLSKDTDIKHICLPGEISSNINPSELADNYEDGLLDPKRMSRKALKGLKTDLGSYGYAGQIMQRPAPEEGGIWQKWFIPISDGEMDIMQHNLKEYGTDWDLAYTDKEQNSASAYVESGKMNNNVYINDLGYRFKEFPELIQFMKTKAGPHYIEGKASGKSAKQTLTREGINAIEVDVEGGTDKIARARSVTPMAESGRVYVRESLLDKLYFDSKQGILSFPNGSHDDLADVIAQALNRHSEEESFILYG